jgi:hypothetical protein
VPIALASGTFIGVSVERKTSNSHDFPSMDVGVPAVCGAFY